jgi:hypothetical protein
MTVQQVDSEVDMFLAHRRGIIKATAPASGTGMTLMLVCFRVHILFAKPVFALYRQTVARFDLDFFEPLSIQTCDRTEVLAVLVFFGQT